MLDILSNMSATERGEFQVDPELETALDLASYNGTGTALCRHMMAKHWSIATFRLASANAMRLYQDVKVSFSDKIATFGNNNLFTIIQPYVNCLIYIQEVLWDFSLV